jgi:aspartate/methionine/tyrosine aminotransferase
MVEGAHTSAKASRFPESVIRETTRLAIAAGAVNLGQGYPDFPCPQELKDAAKAAIDDDVNQYTITWGTPAFREAIAAKTARTYPGWAPDPQTEIVVTCGAQEAMIAAHLGLLDPGDEVITFEPWYESYGPHSIMTGTTLKVVTLREPDWTYDEAELRAAFGPRTRAVIVNTPNNPTGKVFTRAELALLSELCNRWDVLVLSDEIYEHIQYLGPGAHVPPATVAGLEDRTVTINSMSKTYAVTGWRVGWAIADRSLMDGVRKAHDFLTINAAAPLQEAGIVAMALPASYYDQLAASYRERRDVLCRALTEVGFGVRPPDGAYYVMADTSEIDPAGDDVALSLRLIREVGVGAVPGSSFYADRAVGLAARKLRFAFPKKLETLHLAAERLARLRG